VGRRSHEKEYDMDLGLQGKSAIVTGGSEGIGKATAARLAQEGANVLICARRADVLSQAEAEIRAVAVGEVVSLSADVTSQTDCGRVIAEANSRFGGIDILINNAGQSAGGSFPDVEMQKWYSDLDLKLMAAVRFSQAALPFLRNSNSARIVNLTAIAGKAPRAGSLPSSVSRAAGIALTKVMSLDLAKDGILVNTVCIGLVKSGQIGRNAGKRFPDVTLDEAYVQMGQALPLGRVGEPEEVADLIAFLVSERGSYITGTAINADGGASAVV
tara:strand:- start:7397 stop:8212 length:816 start_codon:yes stop_codon:yes gene_type:complete